MPNIKLTISYDGTNYCGWQKQSNQISIQEVIESKLSKICNEKINITGAGRTDAKVHAFEQVANFHTQQQMPALAWQKALNSLLPDDIVITCIEKVDEKFHARYSALKKHYKYSIFLSPTPCPFKRNYSWHIPYQLDVDTMHQAANYLLGEHDFTSFQASGSNVKSSVRTLEEISFSDNNNILEINFTGNGFLRHMVRNITGTLVDVGRKKLAANYIRDILTACDRSKAGPTAPAQGLYLMSVMY